MSLTTKEKVKNLSWPCQEEDLYQNRCKEQCDFCKEEYILETDE